MPPPPRPQPDPLDRALDLAVTKCLRDAARLPAFPHVTRGGDWLTSEHARWTGGFFVGMLWLAAELRGEPGLRATARGWARRLAPRAPRTAPPTIWVSCSSRAASAATASLPIRNFAPSP